ncbi:MAG: aminopeptidase [Candidatus Thorarchaeota archaeon]
MATSFARQIIRDALRVRDRECIWVHTWDHTLDLAQEVAQQAQLHGASVIVSVMTENLLTHVLKKGPQEAVITSPRHWLAGVAKSDGLVVFEGPGDPGIFKSADKGKVLHLTGQITQLLGTAFMNQVRTLHVRSTGFTEQAAKAYGIAHSKLMQENNHCMTGNQSAMIDLGQRIEALLSKHRDIHLSSSEGTDLRFRTEGTPRIDDGIIDQTDTKNKNVFAQLPAGSISIPIKSSSAEGTVVFNWPRAYLGDIVQNLRLDFTKGQITEFRALKGETTFDRAIRAGAGEKDHLTRLTFGINPNASTPLGEALDELIPGTITLGLGDNSVIGGRSRSNLQYSHTLNDAIVSIGPTAVIMDEKLTI